ncbi:conserved hypothetical protein [[Clostridium] ultunense Esp]|nr:conserved hypothetical protein [[Clostridium] ultunense Esp]
MQQYPNRKVNRTLKWTILGFWGAYPEADSATSTYLLEAEGYRLLVDCGSGAVSRLQRHLSIQDLDALILSHYHHDHIADVGVLQYAMLIQNQLGNRKKPLPIYGHRHDIRNFNALTFAEYTTGVSITEDQTIRIGPFEVSFCPTTHPVYCLAMRFNHNGKSLVYTADTEWSEPLVEFARNADLLVCEANLYNHQWGKVGGHLTAGQAGALAAKARVKSLLLTHFPHYGDLETLATQAKETYGGPVALARQDMVLSL